MKKRILSVLLSLAMVVGMFPATALAVEGSETATTKAIVLGTSITSAIKSPETVYKESSSSDYSKKPQSYVYFGVNSANENTPIKWRVLDNTHANNGTTDGIFLLSEDTLGEMTFGDGSSGSNDYNYNGGSSARQWCKGFVDSTSNFTAAEKGAIPDINISETGETSYTNKYNACSLDEEKLFFLSAKELASYVANYSNAPALGTDTWWLRSAVTTAVNLVGVVKNSTVGSEKSNASGVAARPATNVSMSSILFVSPATGGKSSEATGTLAEVGMTDTNEWKLTLFGQ